MKLEERYIRLKYKYPNYVIFIKCGSFYNTYYDDAILVNCLCNYKLVDNKVGFPIASIDRVRFMLYNRNVNSLLVDKNGIG